jgi:hypothetical protein
MTNEQLRECADYCVDLRHQGKASKKAVDVCYNSCIGKYGELQRK